jgi:hypothetical protein
VESIRCDSNTGNKKEDKEEKKEELRGGRGTRERGELMKVELLECGSGFGRVECGGADCFVEVVVKLGVGAGGVFVSPLVGDSVECEEGGGHNDNIQMSLEIDDEKSLQGSFKSAAKVSSLNPIPKVITRGIVLDRVITIAASRK